MKKVLLLVSAIIITLASCSTPSAPVAVVAVDTTTAIDTTLVVAAGLYEGSYG